VDKLTRTVTSCELSIVMPCLNEARTLSICIGKARAFLARSGIAGEIIVADNGSTDGSREVAQALGARVVPVAVRGYGNALRGGIEAAVGTFVIMGDSDDSYDFGALDAFVEQLRTGWDLVLGNRFSGLVAIQPGHTLLTTGIYGVIRHPSYLGMLVNALGWGLAFRSWAGVLLAALLVPLLLARIRSEEALLRAQFGAAYDAYCARTSRLIPGVF